MNAISLRLFVEHLDGTLDPDGVAELNRRLNADATLRRDFAEFLVQDLHLSEIAQQHRLAGRLWPELPELSPRSSTGFYFQWNSLPRPVSAGLVLMAGLAVACFLLWRGEWLGPNQPAFALLDGIVKVERSGQQQSAAVGAPLSSGDRIILEKGASALVRYPGEQTWIRLSDSAQARIEWTNAAKVVSLLRGTLSAVIAPQSARSPMRLTTPNAQATVLGTELTLVAGLNITRLEVWKGKVRMTCSDDGVTADVRTGEFGIVQTGSSLTTAVMRRGVLREYWLGGQPTGAADLASAPCLRRPPSRSDYLPDFTAPNEQGDTFVARFSALLRPPVSGEYVFWVAGDDAAELWLSMDEFPESKAKLCWTTEWTRPGEWDRSASQQSAPIHLEAGRTYYLEALQSEKAGADSFAAAWRTPGSPGDIEIISGNFLTPPHFENNPLAPQTPNAAVLPAR